MYDLNEDTIERIYAGWLGKIIGIRLGAPVEGWTSQEIQEKYGELWDYPVDYHDFAADDDSNGPIFLIRALDRVRNGEKLKAQDVAEALLNYAPFEHGFFWWGGYGVSTEHTAYLNLRHGIPAPSSGSMTRNGKTMAEQIGGQIFIDCWGLVSPGNPEQASMLAREAASVTHDGNGIWGGIFVAVCISLAFESYGIEELILKALSFIPEDCEYTRVVREVISFWKKDEAGDWKKCLRFIQENFGYDKYSGACHIIPNAAVMILALLYGEDDFTRTICICNMCGWDTDCNTGNIGTIMGVRLGLSGIDYDKWRRPINDLLICSGNLGSLNISDVPYGASYMARHAFLLAKTPIPERWKEILEEHPESCHFEYPGSTHAMRTRYELEDDGATFSCVLSNTTKVSCMGEHSLKIEAEGLGKDNKLFLYQKTYYSVEDFQDNRYEPSFSPKIYPGQWVRARVMIPQQGFCVQLYVRDLNDGELLVGEKMLCNSEGWMDLEYVIPYKVGACLGEAGLIFSTGNGDSKHLTAYLDYMEYGGAPDYTIDFSKEHLESWCEHWSSTQREITQFTRVKGATWLEEEWFHILGTDFAESYTGSHVFSDYSFSVDVKPVCGTEHFVNFRVQGAMSSYGVGFSDGGKIKLIKNERGYKLLADAEFLWEYGKTYRLKVQCMGSCFKVWVDEKLVLEYEDRDVPYLSGAVGMSVFNGSHCAYRGLEVRRV